MEKLRFEFEVKASSDDPKSNIICVNSITDVGKNVFVIPEQYQPVKLHDAIMATETFKTVKNTLRRRHDKRQVWISGTSDITKCYRDEDGNMQFKGYLLEEIASTTQGLTPAAGISEEALSRILESFAEIKSDKAKTNSMKNLKEKFVMEKFTRKMSNVMQWIMTFEAECARLGIEEDTKRIEALRLFLDDSCQDWYGAMLIKHTVDSEWSLWKKNFCETYADKSWSPVRYALLFRYRQGSLLEYALKKERMLLEMNKNMDKSTLIDLIAIGLPNFIADKIDRNTLKETEDLFSNIRGLEHLVEKKIWDKKIVGSDNKAKDKNLKEPCRLCEKENRGKRYHPESSCWFKNKSGDRRDQIRSVNNFTLETELNEVDPKNSTFRH
ncbi:uncharacterized protein LOC134651388 [Cydia amplana]|uniref:uncharacterized protein LOC134651388 n=1 Tax=Cydia amplana TaxID=1869771 RepID=UPI002FE507C9